MTDAELIEFATEFREGILDGGPSWMMCAAVAWPLAGLLRFYGMEVETEQGETEECNHVWIRLPDGRVLDPTADQFNLFERYGELPAVYLGPPLAIHGAP